jgi:hypothetical protein
MLIFWVKFLSWKPFQIISNRNMDDIISFRRKKYFPEIHLRLYWKMNRCQDAIFNHRIRPPSCIVSGHHLESPWLRIVCRYGRLIWFLFLGSSVLEPNSNLREKKYGNWDWKVTNIPWFQVAMAQTLIASYPDILISGQFRRIFIVLHGQHFVRK